MSHFRTQNTLTLNPSPMAGAPQRRSGTRGKDPAFTLTLRQGDTRPNLILTLSRGGTHLDIRDAQDTKAVLHVLDPSSRQVILELTATFVNLYLGSVVFPEWPAEWSSALHPGAYPGLIYINQCGQQESALNEIWLDVQRAGFSA